MLGIKDYGLLLLVAVVVSMGAYIDFNNRRYEAQLADKDKTILQTKVQATLYKSSLDIQTVKIQAIAVDYNKSIAELDMWKNKPAEVKYEVIYKYIPKLQYVKGECNDTKELIDSINYIDYNLL